MHCMCVLRVAPNPDRQPPTTRPPPNYQPPTTHPAATTPALGAQVKVVRRGGLEDAAASAVQAEEVLQYDPAVHTGFTEGTAYVYLLTK